MNIKNAETLSGVSRQNIRFYEREGLLTPARNPENDYREYTPAHIQTLKQIRAMRLLDMPLDRIRLVLDGQLSPAEAAGQQKQKLKEQQAQLAAAIRFCEEWSGLGDLEAMDVDAMLTRMEQPENAPGLFQQWREDYRKVALSEKQKVFSFIPEGAVTNPREFTEALFAHAEKQGVELVITKESMYPEFTINGIEYRAERVYTVVQRVPVAVVRCEVLHPEDFEPDVPEKRKKILKLLTWLWIPALLILLLWGMIAGWEGILSSWEGWVMLISFAALSVVSVYRMRLIHFNEIQ